MTPSKFGLFKSRSRDQPEQPSTENLLNSISSDISPYDSVTLPIAPSNGLVADDKDVDLSLQELRIQESHEAQRRRSQQEGTTGYKQFKDDISTDATSITTLQVQDDEFDKKQQYDVFQSDAISLGSASTLCDASSIQFDRSSMAASEDMSVVCAGLRKSKKSESSEKERTMRDYGMWHASNIEVMQNLLGKTGTYEDQIKWQAIATARGLCTLEDNCTCPDCRHAKYLASVSDGDGGIGAAPFGDITMGCTLQ